MTRKHVIAMNFTLHSMSNFENIELKRLLNFKTKDIEGVYHVPCVDKCFLIRKPYPIKKSDSNASVLKIINH